MPCEVWPYVLRAAIAEVAGQHGAGQDHHDLVADGEVAGAADDLLRLAGAVGLADVDRAEADRLLEALQLLDGQHLADDQRALEAGAELLDGLDLQAGGDELGLDVAAGLTSAGRSTYSRSQESGTRIRSPSRTAG